MAKHKDAGKLAPRSILADIPKLMTAYYALKPDAKVIGERVAFGTSGHRGSSIKKSFNEDHIIAISAAITEYRTKNNITGPLYMAADTHALSTPAFATALEVFAATGVTVRLQRGPGYACYTPTPVLSHAILTYNKGRSSGFADGVVITPSHNPPEDGGFKYNPPSGGPADTDITDVIEARANELLGSGLGNIKRLSFERALKADTTEDYEYITPYVSDLKNIIDMEAIRNAGLRIGADPLGGSGIAYWEPIAERYGLDIDLVNPYVDPTFSFMTLDKDGKIRMDCSSPYAMAGLIKLKDKYDIAFGNDTDFDRHGIVTRGAGLLNPNHYLSVAVSYLFQNRPGWSAGALIGKTCVSSSMIDRVAASLGRGLSEVPVGFKWFVEGLLDGSYGFGGEESAGASFLRFDGSSWSTDKDGIIMDLLAAEITAKTGADPAVYYEKLKEQFGDPIYERTDAPATREQKAILKKLSPEMVTATELAGEPITEKLTHATGNKAAIGGLKVVTQNGWFAARPSGTEDIYKIYAESFTSPEHLKEIQKEAQEIVDGALLG